MNYEETILDEQFVNNTSKQKESKATPSSTPQPKKSSSAEKWAYGAAGVVIGVGTTMAGQAVAATTSKEDTEVKVDTEPEKETAAAVANTEETTDARPEETLLPNPEDSPNPEDVIIATDDGVRVAQVSDDLSFGQAFAEARAQVGSGGVFEWHGKVYGTYYKDEWEAMTPQERAEYQASIDYEDIASNHNTHSHAEAVVHDHQTVHHVHHIHHEHTTVHHGEHHTSTPQTNAVETQEDVQVSIIGAGETDLNGDGVPEYSVLLDCNGQEVLIVDIDTDGFGDVAMSDINNNGQIDQGEIEDISDLQIQMPAMQQEQDAYMAASNDMPDYMNDADAGSYMA